MQIEITRDELCVQIRYRDPAGKEYVRVFSSDRDFADWMECFVREDMWPEPLCRSA